MDNLYRPEVLKELLGPYHNNQTVITKLHNMINNYNLYERGNSDWSLINDFTMDYIDIPSNQIYSMITKQTDKIAGNSISTSVYPVDYNFNSKKKRVNKHQLLIDTVFSDNNFDSLFWSIANDTAIGEYAALRVYSDPVNGKLRLFEHKGYEFFFDYNEFGDLEWVSFYSQPLGNYEVTVADDIRHVFVKYYMLDGKCYRDDKVYNGNFQLMINESSFANELPYSRIPVFLFFNDGDILNPGISDVDKIKPLNKRLISLENNLYQAILNSMYPVVMPIDITFGKERKVTSNGQVIYDDLKPKTGPNEIWDARTTKQALDKGKSGSLETISLDIKMLDSIKYSTENIKRNMADILDQPLPTSDTIASNPSGKAFNLQDSGMIRRSYAKFNHWKSTLQDLIKFIIEVNNYNKIYADYVVDGKPFVVDVDLNTENFEDERANASMYLELQKAGILSKRSILSKLGFNADEELRMLDEEINTIDAFDNSDSGVGPGNSPMDKNGDPRAIKRLVNE